MKILHIMSPPTEGGGWVGETLFLKNGTYYVTGHGIRPSVNSFANSSYSLHPIKLKLGL